MNAPPRDPDLKTIATDASATSELGSAVHPVAPRPNFSISKQDLRNVPDEALHKYVRVSPVEKERTSGKALAALVFGFVGIPLMGILVGPVAILFGVWALYEIRRVSYLRGRSMAISGIVLGTLDIILWVGLFLIWGLTLLRGA